MEWGPPNFGEHPESDSKWFAWMLKLDHPISVTVGDYSNSQETVELSLLQIRGRPELGGAYNKFENAHVVVQGLLWQAGEPSDITQVTMETEHIDETELTKCVAERTPPKRQ
jgi:hypothetical protein